MKWKDRTTKTALVMALLTAGLYAIWHAQPRPPKPSRVGNRLVVQPEEPRGIAPLAEPAVSVNEHTDAPQCLTQTSPASLIIKATPSSVLPDGLQLRFPSARSMEPVEITSLADQLALHGSPSEPLQRLQLPALHGRTVDVIVEQHRKIHARRGTMTGKVAGIAFSEVIVSYAGEAITASVSIPGREHMEIAYAGNGCHVLLDIDPAKILPNAPPVIPSSKIFEVPPK